jgi:hypothetical protein
LAPSANCASAKDLASRILPSAARSLRCTTDNSIILAMKMVHVTREANASPIMTALTRMSADRNIDQGDSSRSPEVADLSALLLASTGAAVASGAGTDGATADGSVAGAGNTA